MNELAKTKISAACRNIMGMIDRFYNIGTEKSFGLKPRR